MNTLGQFVKLGLVVLTLTTTSFGAAAPKRAPHNLSASSSSSGTTSTRRKVGVDLLLGAGVNDVYGSWGMNVRIGAEYRIPNKPFLVGAETGLMFGWGATGIPFLATGTYEISDFASKKFQPRFGLSFGPMISVGHSYYWWYYRSESYSTVSLLILTRPGAQIQLSDSIALNAELVVGGSLSGMFIIAPEATLAIKL